MTEFDRNPPTGLGYTPFKPTERPLAQWRQRLKLAACVLLVPVGITLMLPVNVEVIHTIAYVVGDGKKFSVLENKDMSKNFMKQLAEESGGTFKCFE